MVLVLVPIGLLLAAFVLLSLSTNSRTVSDSIVRWCFGWLVFLPFAGRAIEPAILDLSKWISHTLGNVYIRLAKRPVSWLAGMAQYVRFIADSTLYQPIKLLEAVRWLLATEIPHLIKGLPTAVTRLVHDASRIVSGLERDVGRLTAHLPGQVRTLIKAALIGAIGPFLLPLRWLLHSWRQIAHAAAHAGSIALPWVEVPKLTRRANAQAKRLTRIEKLLGVAAASALVARAFRISTTCVRDGNVGKLARRLCGLDSLLMDALLLDTVLIVGAISVVDFAEGLLAIEDEAVKILGVAIREFPG